MSRHEDIAVVGRRALGMVRRKLITSVARFLIAPAMVAMALTGYGQTRNVKTFMLPPDVNPTLTCQTKTGNGSLDANGQFTDHVASACSSQPLTCTQTSTQSLSVADFPVRSNALDWTSTGVTYTNKGPTQ